MTQGTKQTVQVQKVNDNGVYVDGTWLNFSKFFDGNRPDGPGTYEVVLKEFQGRQFVQSARQLAASAQSSMTTTGSSGGGYGGRSADTDKKICRQVAAKIAADNAHRFIPDPLPGSTLPVSDWLEAFDQIASNVEVWINRPFSTASTAEADES